MLGVVANPQPCLQEADEDDHLGEAELPGRFLPLPAVYSVGLARLVGRDVTILIPVDLISCLRFI
jgi:hypothetical protein